MRLRIESSARQRRAAGSGGSAMNGSASRPPAPDSASDEKKESSLTEPIPQQNSSLNEPIPTIRTSFPATPSSPPRKKNDDHYDNQSLPNIDEHRPVSRFPQDPRCDSVCGNSVFTDKKQDDLDRLFEDLLGNSKDDVSLASTAMSSIMPTISTPQIRARPQTDEHSQAEDSFLKPKSAPPADPYSSNQYIFAGKQHPPSEHHHQSRSSLNFNAEDHFSKFYINRKKRMTEVRAGLTLLFLVGVMFVAVQLSSVVQHDREEMKSIKSEYYNGNVNVRYNRKGRYEGDHEEMVDRPVRVDALTKTAIRRASPQVIPLGRQQQQEGKMKTLNDDPKPITKVQQPPVSNAGPVDPLPQAKEAKEAEEQKPLTVPESFDNYGDLKASFLKGRDVPFFWQVPRSGATTLKQIFGNCLGVTMAAEPGSKNAYAQDGTVEVFKEGSAKYVNVDTTYVAGINRAKELKLLPSGLVDIIVSPYVHPASTLFTSDHRGRMFAVFRHPIERAAAQYEFLKTVNPEIRNMSLIQYASSQKVENNWMTRFLSDKMSGQITQEHLVVAKEILRTKCLVGLYTKLWASLKRFEEYFGWQYVSNPQQQYECRKQTLLENVDGAKYPVPKFAEGSQEWTMLLWQNKYDMKLYKYAEELFKEQVSLFPAGKVPT